MSLRFALAGCGMFAILAADIGFLVWAARNPGSLACALGVLLIITMPMQAWCMSKLEDLSGTP